MLKFLIKLIGELFYCCLGKAIGIFPASKQ